VSRQTGQSDEIHMRGVCLTNIKAPNYSARLLLHRCLTYWGQRDFLNYSTWRCVCIVGAIRQRPEWSQLEHGSVRPPTFAP
jgi:hypothetical protein